MSIKFLALAGGGILGFGGECRFYFYGRADFSDFAVTFESFGSDHSSHLSVTFELL